MAYTQPKSRSLSALDGTQFYPSAGTKIDVSRFVATAVPAGSRGRIVANGETLEEANNPGVPVRFVGNNCVLTFPYTPLDKTKTAAIVAKYRAKGINFVRLHGLENYILVGGALYTNGTARVGNRNYDSTRWDEVDYLLSSLKAAGIYYGIGIMSRNLGLNLGNTADRFATIVNNTGAATASLTGDGVSSIAVTNAGTAFTFPPTVLITGGEGTDAKATAVLDGSGNLVSVTVTNPGTGYTSPPAIAFWGGSLNCKTRIRFDDVIKEEWRLLLSDMLSHVNGYTSIALKNDPALVFVEGYNESGLTFLEAVNSGVVPTQLIPNWQSWLKARYGTISAVNTKWGTSFTSFTDTNLNPKTSGFSASTNAEKWHFTDSMYWKNQSDADLYSWYSARIREMGYTGIITSVDIVAAPYAVKVFKQSGAGMQTIHAYPALQDSYATGQRMRAGSNNNNAPFAYDNTPITNALAFTVSDAPKFWTEAGYSMPSKYRGELGLVFGGLSSMYNFSGIDFHADGPQSTTWGAASNVSRAKGANPCAWEHDPLSIASVFLATMMFHRRDVDVIAVDKTYVMSDRALEYHADYSEVAVPFFGVKTLFMPAALGAMCISGRVGTTWNATADATVAATWQTEVGKNITTLMSDMSLNSGHEAYDWVVTKSNNGTSSSTDNSAQAVLYSKNRQVFSDQLAGVFGINTARTQAGVVSKPFIKSSGTVVRNGSAFAANSPRTLAALPGNNYKLNYLGNRFWSNLEINYANDGTLIGITSATTSAITDESNIIVAVAQNCYNYNASWSANDNTVVSVPVTAGGTGYTSPPDITFSGGSGNGARGIGIVAGGVLTGVLITQGGTGYVTAPTAAISGGGGSGATLGTVVLTADDEAKEILLNLPYTADGNEGWPISMRRHVVDFNIIGVSTAQPWILYELDYTGARIASYPVKNLANGINVRIDSSKTLQPSVFFELVRGERYRKARS